jgi:hypothetical protein
MIVAFSGTRIEPLRAEVEVDIRRILEGLSVTTRIAVGDCPSGVDRYVRTQVRGRLLLVVFHAAWNAPVIAKSAGPLRNLELASFADELFAYPERNEALRGSGTWDCVRAFEGVKKPRTIFDEDKFARLTKRSGP